MVPLAIDTFSLKLGVSGDSILGIFAKGKLPLRCISNLTLGVTNEGREAIKDLVPIWYRRTSSPTSSRTRASLMVKQSLMGRTRLCNTRTSRRRMARRKVLVMCAEILIIGLLVALLALTSVILGKAARPLMLFLETLI